MEPVLKTGGQQCLVGSNPTPSAPCHRPRPPAETRMHPMSEMRDRSARAPRARRAIARHGRLKRSRRLEVDPRLVGGTLAVVLVARRLGRARSPCSQLAGAASRPRRDRRRPRRRPRTSALSRAASTSCSSAATPARARAASAATRARAQRRQHALHVAQDQTERAVGELPARHGRAAPRAARTAGPPRRASRST